jgi:putative ABC transport system permease protein
VEDIESPAKPAIYAPMSQSGRRTSMLIVRTTGDPADFASIVRREIHALDRNHVVSEVKTMRERLLDSAARSRFASRVLATFAFIALTLAALGIYGVVSLAVMQRRREFSVRLALGAGQSRLLTMVLREAFGLVVVGGVLGIVGAYIATRAMTSLLYGVSSVDAPTYVASAAILMLVALIAALLPALRATRVQPAAVLRGD